MEEFYTTFSNEIRVRILELLEKGLTSYTDLLKTLKIGSTGKLNFHLNKLEGYWEKTDEGYKLSPRGKKFLEIFHLNKKIFDGDLPLDMITPSTPDKKKGIHRVGVLLCTCRGDLCNIIGGPWREGGPAGTIKALKARIARLNGVVSVKNADQLCQARYHKEISGWIQANYINRVVVAACSPHLHEHLFAEIFRDALPLNHVEFVNTREQVSWVNEADKPGEDRVMEKITLLIQAAVARSILQEEYQSQAFSVEKSVAIIGGGIAGINLAKNLASAGIPKIYLIDSSPTLGGKVIRWSEIEGFNDCCACILSEELVDLATYGEQLEIFSYTRIKEISGVTGNYNLTLEVKRRVVDTTKCHACQSCVLSCQALGKMRSNEFEFGLQERPLIAFPFNYAFPYLPNVNPEDINQCLECRKCEATCRENAIDFSAAPYLRDIKVGAIVFAIGADINETYPEYLFQNGENVLTAPQFERLLSVDGPTQGRIVTRDGQVPKKIAIIQCAGPMLTCNRFCCLTAKKYLDAIKIQLDPGCEVRVFYDLDKLPLPRLDNWGMINPAESLSNFLWHISMEKRQRPRTSDMLSTRHIPPGIPVPPELGYLVRRLKIIPLDLHKPVKGIPKGLSCLPGTTQLPWSPKVDEKGLTYSSQKIRYEIYPSPRQKRVKEWQPDLILLNNGVRPSEDVKFFKNILDFNLTRDGFIFPGSLPSGIYAAGMVTGPKGYREVLNETNEVFVKVLQFLAGGKIAEVQSIVEVNNEACSKCGLCVTVCPYGALKWRMIHGEQKLTLDLLSCRACGMCVVACPSKALEHPYNSTEKILATIDILSTFQFAPKAIAFCCRSCGYAASDEAGRNRLHYNPNVFVVPVPCMGRLDANFILYAFERGFDMVFCIGCHEGNCRYHDGVTTLKERIAFLTSAFPELDDKIIHIEVSAVEGALFANKINESFEHAAHPSEEVLDS